MDFLRAATLRLHRAALAELVQRLFPGGRLVRTRRLPGGLTARMDVLEIEERSGARRKATLRRCMTREHCAPEHVAGEFKTLRTLARHGLPAPRPLFLDAEGGLFGVPAIVLSYVPGRPIFPYGNNRSWTRGLARAIRQVHGITPGRDGLSWLEVRREEWMQTKIDGFGANLTFAPLAPEMYATLKEHLPRTELLPPALTHNDFWFGNTIWFRGNLAAIVDWTDAVVGDPRSDVAECRVDFALSHGLEAGDSFREDYEDADGMELRDLWFFDLYRGFNALRQYEDWLVGYHDLGQTHITADAAGARLRAFLRRALDHADRGSRR